MTSTRHTRTRTTNGRRRQARRGLVGVLLAALVGCLAGCNTTGSASGTVLDYWLWDANQLPGYQKCIVAFEDENPDIDVRISQYGYDDYWSKLTAALVAGAGPDVFTDHVTKYPEFVERGVLLPLESLKATSDIDPEEFQPGLAELWQGKDGSQYGMPKDFDTVGLFYNEKLLADAGLSEQDMQGLTWNPQDGGTFEDLIAHLSVDSNGVRGDEEGFDPKSVKTYGLASAGSGGYVGQTQWSWLTAATGWTYTDAEFWGEEFNFDDPRFQDTIKWYFGLVDKGYLPRYEIVGSEPNPQQQLGSGSAAISADGSWMISTYSKLEGLELGVAKTPTGPIGHPMTMKNGLGDSISAQTENPEVSAQLVAYLGSDACQVIIGQQGSVFPARPAGTKAAVKAFEEQGVDTSAFTEPIDDGDTFPFPVTKHGASITSMMEPVMTDIYIGSRDVSTLTDINQKINALFR